jgi:hypothetical protein
MQVGIVALSWQIIIDNQNFIRVTNGGVTGGVKPGLMLT